MRQGITLNGISIWHEPFERRHSASVEYYFIRNFMIIGASRNITNTFNVITLILKKIILGLLHYNYEECNRIFDAIEDFYKGLDYLIAQDPDEFHKQISAKDIKLQEIRQLDFKFSLRKYFASLEFQDKGLKRLLRHITFNGYFLPSITESVITNDVTQSRKRIGNMYRAKKVMQYDITRDSGIVFDRSLPKALVILARFILISTKLLFTLSQKNMEYRRKLPYVQTQRFWEDFLKIKK
jgi:hypothetical protein